MSKKEYCKCPIDANRAKLDSVPRPCDDDELYEMTDDGKFIHNKCGLEYDLDAK